MIPLSNSAKKDVGVAVLTLQQKCGFSEYRLTCKHGRAQLFPLLYRPIR